MIDGLDDRIQGALDARHRAGGDRIDRVGRDAARASDLVRGRRISSLRCGCRLSGLRPSETPLQTVGRSATGPLSQQPAGQSAAGRNESGTNKSDPQRAAEIEHTEHPTSVSGPQREKIRQALARIKPDRRDQVDFSLVIGSAVPRDVKLDDLPTDIADSLNGYNGDQYLVVRDQLVIIDHQSRRVVALIPGVA